MGKKCIGELNIVEINRELHKRGIDTGGSKVDGLLIHEEYIRTKELIDQEHYGLEKLTRRQPR